MKKSERDKYIRKINENMKRKRGSFLTTFLIIFLGGYFMFFTSSLWLPPSYDNIRVSEKGTVVSFNDRDVMLVSWEWDKEKSIMKVVLEINNSSVDGMNEYKWSCIDKNKGFFDVEVIVEKDDFIVLNINKVAGRWTEMSLRMDSTKKNDETFNTIKFYTSKKSITITNVETKNEKEYRLEAINKKLTIYNAKIEGLKEKIKKENSLIENTEITIESLKEKKKYETEEEQIKTNEKITGLESSITSSKDKIDELNDEITEYKEKINKQHEKEKALKNNDN